MKYDENKEIYRKCEILGNKKITIFSMSKGAILSFSEISHVRIYPINPGHIGGKYYAKTFGQHKFRTGLGSEKYQNGVMVGEPGSLYFSDPSIFPEISRGQLPELHLSLAMDKNEFDITWNTILDNIANVSSAFVEVTADLFEKPSFADPRWPEYGILIKDGEPHSAERARLDGISINYSSPKQQNL